jgi:LacI family transcriptional regulator
MLVIKLKKAVIALAGELNYTPNSFAVNLRTKEKNYRFDYSRSGSSFLSNVIKGIIAKLRKRAI